MSLLFLVLSALTFFVPNCVLALFISKPALAVDLMSFFAIAVTLIQRQECNGKLDDYLISSASSNMAPAFLLDRLAHAGYRLDAVPGVESRRVNHVPEPRPSRQSSWVREPAFALDQLLVNGPYVRVKAAFMLRRVRISLALLRKNVQCVFQGERSSDAEGRVASTEELRLSRGSVGSLEHPLVDLQIPFFDLCALIGRKFLQFIDVTVNRVRKIGELEWASTLSVGQPDYGRARSLRKRASIDEIGIGKMRVPIEVVVDRVVDAPTTTFTSEAEVQ